MLLHTGPGSALLWTHWLHEPGPAFAIAATALTYTAGTRALWRQAGAGRGIRRWQAWSFRAGLLTLAVALVSPVGTLAEELFWVHMVQHVLLAIVAPPLLVVGAPMVSALWLLPREMRRRVARAVKRQQPLVAIWRFCTRPLVACALHAVALWTWHAPALYTLALTHPAAHAAEHASFLLTAMLLWWAIVHPRTPRRSGYAMGTVILFLTMMQSGALGALLTLSQRTWFPAQTNAAAWGLTPLQDQQLAGLIMWVPAALLYMVAMAVVFRAMLSERTLMFQPTIARDAQAA